MRKRRRKELLRRLRVAAVAAGLAQFSATHGGGFDPHKPEEEGHDAMGHITVHHHLRKPVVGHKDNAIVGEWPIAGECGRRVAGAGLFLVFRLLTDSDIHF